MCFRLSFIMALLALGGGLSNRGESLGATATLKEPGLTRYLLKNAPRLNVQKATSASWVEAARANQGGESVFFGNRLVLQMADPSLLHEVLSSWQLELSRTIGTGLFILQASNAAAAFSAAASLSSRSDVLAATPIRRVTPSARGIYASRPNDPYFSQQWYLENRTNNGVLAGLDLNVREAWAWTRGAGVTIAIVDSGVDLEHPDLAAALAGQPHYNFLTSVADGNPFDDELGPVAVSNHGTSVAGLAAARAGNKRGISGVAPEANLASWVILGANLSDERMMDMYESGSSTVAIQNHSWGSILPTLRPLSLLERIGISNAVYHGRGGLGVVMVRAAGNERAIGSDANDEEEVNIPEVVSVAALRRDGRAASYSNRGACILVGAPSGDEADGFTNIVTTDRLGAFGYNSLQGKGDSADYAFGTNGFSGTSAATPQIAGIIALMLSANPRLAVRDVQHLLALSARHFDFLDHDLKTNGAGFRVSHSLGFGVPDAGEAVGLARFWSNRPPVKIIRQSSNIPKSIPERPLLEINGLGVSADLLSPRCLPSFGPEPEAPTRWHPLADAGLGDTNLVMDLTGKAAFLLRGDIFFWEKIDRAAELGAAFAIVRNNRDTNQLVLMGATEHTRIPAVFISEKDGSALENLLQVPGAPLEARLNFNSDGTAAAYEFQVTEGLLCEHAGVRIPADHPRRGDLRVTLVSPSGLRSIMQRVGVDAAAASDWTYYSTHHFGESSVGTWKVFVLDQQTGSTGSVLGAELILRGTPMSDTDADGLDDDWERLHFKTLAYGPQDDPDRDGYSNAREQLMGTNPALNQVPFAMDLSPLGDGNERLSWASRENQLYQLYSAGSLGGPFSLLTNIYGASPETEIVLPAAAQSRFFKLFAPAP